MPTHRKLFLGHASELAHRLVRTFGGPWDGPGLVPQFTRSYAQRFDRPGLLGNPARVLELHHTITREALLVAAVELRPRLPQAFARSRGDRMESQDAALAGAFFTEFMASVGRSLDWHPSDEVAEREFLRRDLALYERWTKRSAPQSQSGRRAATRGGAALEESPFPDRCALLLDPAMMEQARRAAAEFEKEILRATARTFAQLGAEARRAVPSHSPARKRGKRSKSPRRAKPAPKRARGAPAARRRAPWPHRRPTAKVSQSHSPKPSKQHQPLRRAKPSLRRESPRRAKPSRRSPHTSPHPRKKIVPRRPGRSRPRPNPQRPRARRRRKRR